MLSTLLSWEYRLVKNLVSKPILMARLSACLREVHKCVPRTIWRWLLPRSPQPIMPTAADLPKCVCDMRQMLKGELPSISAIRRLKLTLFSVATLPCHSSMPILWVWSLTRFLATITDQLKVLVGIMVEVGLCQSEQSEASLKLASVSSVKRTCSSISARLDMDQKLSERSHNCYFAGPDPTFREFLYQSHLWHRLCHVSLSCLSLSHLF